MTDALHARALATFQARVQPWLMSCFGAQIAGDREERNHRFLEEALELPDEIDLFRILRRAGRSDMAKARAVLAALPGASWKEPIV